MICMSCMKEIEDGALFCPSCGTKVEDMLNREKKSAAVSDVFGDSRDETVISPAVSSINIPRAPQPPSADAPAFGPNIMPAAPAPVQTDRRPDAPEKKEFFGRGAFVLCLIVIGLLSASTGAFAFMYFSLLGRI